MKNTTSSFSSNSNNIEGAVIFYFHIIRRSSYLKFYALLVLLCYKSATLKRCRLSLVVEKRAKQWVAAPRRRGIEWHQNTVGRLCLCAHCLPTSLLLEFFERKGIGNQKLVYWFLFSTFALLLIFQRKVQTRI